MLVKTLKKNFAVIFFYTMDIKNIIFNPKFYQHFLPSLIMSDITLTIMMGYYILNEQPKYSRFNWLKLL